MTKVVIDTNVLVSAVINERGAEAAVLDFIATGKLIWYTSALIVAEYQGVLARPKFARLDPDRLGRVLKSLARATLVVPTVTRAESPDDPDSRFLECAEVAEAAYLVTGNIRHFPAQWKGTRVLNARKLVAAVQSEK